jgi:UDP-2,4-diacetamido-2,4,6-trideoxy-beta-L-altropyranose hydrolase
MKPICVAIIPVRGGSKGIPRKNARLLNGKPLLYYAIRAALSSGCFADVYVSTDDEELEYLSVKFGAKVLDRPPHLSGDEVGLDEVIVDAVASVERDSGAPIDYVATIQATSPLISPTTIERAVNTCSSEKLDTVVSVFEDTHLGWKLDEDGRIVPDYRRRVNRQHLPTHYRETGGIVVCRREQLETGTRFGARVGTIEQVKKEAVDIDDRFDWWLVEKQMRRKTVVFRVEGYEEIGLGHVYRCLTLADNMLDHDITFVVSENSQLAIKLLESRFYDVVTFGDPGDEIETIRSCNPHIVVNDILDTKAAYVRALKKLGYKVVNFEDQGSGHRQADAVINAMYGSSSAKNNVHSGLDYVCLRDEFYTTKPIRFRKKVKNLLVMFGGVDPSRLTQRVVKWLLQMPYGGKVTIITGPGYRDIEGLVRQCEGSENIEVVSDTKIVSKYMNDADIAITSAGRTVFELASLGIPMIVLCQNKREQSHVTARKSKGVVNLGLGKQVKFEEFQRSLTKLLNSADLRGDMHRALRGHKFKNGVKNVWNIILRS